MTNSRLPISSLVALFFVSALGHLSAAATAPHAGSVASAPFAHFFTLIAAGGSGHNALQADAQKPKTDDPLPDGKGKEVIKRVCSGCHAVQVFATQRHTPEQWASIVDAMASKGMDASDDEITTITTYLATNLPAPKQDAPAAASPESPAQQ